MIDLIHFLRKHSPQQLAFIQATDSKTVTYGTMIAEIERRVESLQRTKPALAFLYASNTIEAIFNYLACRIAHFPLGLIQPNLTGWLRLVESYRPQFVFLPHDISPPAGYLKENQYPNSNFQLYLRTEKNEHPLVPDPELALLLTTSGSTGSPKLVRLTELNLQANARSIAEYLQLSADERSIQGLPIHYSYGLSLINSHLIAGGTTILTSHSFMRPEFWGDFDQYKCTSFAGVPYMYETLNRLKFQVADHFTLRTMTQAGGGLRPDLIESFYKQTQQSKCRFFVMYGQTEATARISYVPPERLGEKIGSIGLPIPDGQMEIIFNEEEDGKGELIYRGPNVMMGYAEKAFDLALGDQMHGVLATGDLVRLDEEGYFYLVGRLKRIAKLFGRRISLDDVESHLETIYPVRTIAVERENRLLIFFDKKDEVEEKTMRLYLSKYLNTTPQAITFHLLHQLPLTSSGKKDYKALSL